MKQHKWSENDIPDQSGRVVVVTGSNTGLGLDTARALAERGAQVVLAVRNLDKGKAACEKIRQSVPDAEVSTQRLDLGSLESVRTASAELRAAHPRIDLLINNAAVAFPPRTMTPEGFELQFATNHLGHFALTGLLLENMLDVDGARVVVVASLDHKLGGAIHFDDLQWERRYSSALAYAQSKLANLMFCYEFHRRLVKSGAPLMTVTAHPGYSHSELFRNMWKPVQAMMKFADRFIGQDPAKGALPQLYTATMPDVQGGQYWGPDGFLEMAGYPTLVRSSKKSYDQEVQQRLWTVSEELTGVTYPV
ncbi:SDR family NAD(P)-dependent oxidoreductase [Mycolicibacterium sp. P1-5]|uniref:SDR family NAD(P)-dependent oxidoreductase n=1 Tax=Mycolicibacterium sp. P1-5 TaxID=2024617 RepID=UPI0011EBB979|nr:SDR family NAD(P)-dependent oxidoreductase [Mycolicibacterium sp. P1-5]KAA0108217.1 SDR family NAD(P)-dependent oxidoreductase [Mycolicibacterium sp. P1-5]